MFKHITFKNQVLFKSVLVEKSIDLEKKQKYISDNNIVISNNRNCFDVVEKLDF